MKAIHELVEFCLSTSFESLPAPVAEKTKLLVTDVFGNLVAGRGSESSVILGRSLAAQGGQAEATMVGSRTRIPVGNAVLANAAMAHSLEMDDTHNESCTHTGAAIVPSVLAAAEKEGGVTGQDLLVSTVLGVEVMARVSKALHPTILYAKGYHPSSLCGPFGVVAAVGKVLRLRPDQMVNAFGLAGIQSAGLLCAAESEFSWHFQYGRAAQSGIQAAYLARQGAEGPADIFEGKGGLASIFSTEAKMKELASGLGQSYAIEGLSFKMHAGLHFGQASADALLTVLKEHSLPHAAIQGIRLHLPTTAFDIIDERAYPTSGQAAKASPRYLMAVAAIDRVLTPAQFSTECLGDERIRDLFGRVEVVADESLDGLFPSRWPAAVEVATKGGEAYSCEVRNARGDADNPPTRDEIEAKFTNLVEGRLDQARAQDLLRQLGRLDSLDAVSGLAQALGDVIAE